MNALDKADRSNTAIAIWKSTKDKLDKNRALGQCYSGFISQLVDLWEQTRGERTYNRAGSADVEQETGRLAITY